MIGIISEDGREFISKLLVNSPNKRMGARKAMRHSWLKDVDLKEKFNLKSDIEIIYKLGTHEELKQEEEYKADENMVYGKKGYSKLSLIEDDYDTKIEEVPAINPKKQRKISVSRRDSSLQSDDDKDAKEEEEDEEVDDIFTIERVEIALDNDDKYEILEMFKSLMEQNKEYIGLNKEYLRKNKKLKKKVKVLEEDNVSLQNVINTKMAKHRGNGYGNLKRREISRSVSRSHSGDQAYRNGDGGNDGRTGQQQHSMIDIIDEMSVGDMMTPLMTETPVQTNATPIYGIDL